MKQQVNQKRRIRFETFRTRVFWSRDSNFGNRLDLLPDGLKEKQYKKPPHISITVL